jgi:transposase, IS30 family
MSHTHLTIFERDRVANSFAAGFSIRKIALDLQRAPSTISRELRRNSHKQEYFAHAAQQKAGRRKRGRPNKKMDDPKTAKIVKEKLRQDFSPQLIVKRLKICNVDISIGKQAIYDWIDAEEKKGRKWRRCLPRRGKPYVKRHGVSPVNCSKKSIHERSSVIDNRERLGDWEGDTLEGCKGGVAVVTLLERRSRYTVLCPVEDRSSSSLNAAVKDRFHYQRKLPRHTLTVDRGREFADGLALGKAFKGEVYFADAHSPWQKGAVEQVNGLLRRYLPKGFDKSYLKRLELAEERLNSRPRKCLGYLTPYEVLFGMKPVL